MASASGALIRSGDFIYSTTPLAPPIRGQIKIALGDGSIHTVKFSDLCPLSEIDGSAGATQEKDQVSKFSSEAKEQMAYQEILLNVREAVLKRVMNLKQDVETGASIDDIDQLIQFYQLTSHLLLDSQEAVRKEMPDLETLIGIAREVSGSTSFSILSAYSGLLRTALERGIISVAHLKSLEGNPR